MLNKILEIFKKHNIAIDDETKKELDSIDVEENKNIVKDKIVIDSSSDSYVKEILSRNKALEENVKNLSQLIQNEKTIRENMIKETEERMKKEKDEKVKSAVEKLFTEKKITEAQKETWTKLYTNDFESASKISNELKSLEKEKPVIPTSTNSSENNKFEKPNFNTVRDLIKQQMENN